MFGIGFFMEDKIITLDVKLGHNPNSIVVFFKNCKEFSDEVLNFLDNHPKIDYEVRDGGTIITTPDAINIFNKEKFNFVTAKNTKELNEKYPEDIKEYTQQVRDYYRLPRRIYT